MDKDFNLTDPENETVKIGGSNDPVNNNSDTDEAIQQPLFKTPTPISEAKTVEPTPIAPSKPFADDLNATVRTSAPPPSQAPSSSDESGRGGIRTTYVPGFSQTARSNDGYSSYSMNSSLQSGTAQTSGNGASPEKKKKGSFTFGKALVIVLVTMLLTTAVNIGLYSFMFADDIKVVREVSEKEKKEANAPGNVAGEESEAESNPELSTKDPEAIAEKADGSVEKAVEIAANSVVEISTEIVVSGGFFYGNYVESGAGSGVIIDAENGYIITCAHVIDGASAITVKLKNGESYEAEVMGSDAQTDIAVIRIEAEGLVAAAIDPESDKKLVVGQTAIAIGNPLGTLGGTVSKGIVSALNREIVIDGQKYSLIQIDTSVNPGNSGGGLFDIAGNLIGIVNAKSGGTDYSTTIEGLGFAIPINEAQKIAKDLVDFGYVGNRAYLGISVVEYDGTQQNVDRELRDYIAAGGEGVYFIEYLNGQSGDLVYGDKIVAIDGNEVSSKSEITDILSEYSVGDKITLTVSRLNTDRGRRQMVDVSLTLVSAATTQG